MPERFPSKVRDPADNNDPHKIGRREPRAEYLGWLHCRQINEIIDHCAWMSSQADSRVVYPGATTSSTWGTPHLPEEPASLYLRQPNRYVGLILIGPIDASERAPVAPFSQSSQACAVPVARNNAAILVKSSFFILIPFR